MTHLDVPTVELIRIPTVDQHVLLGELLTAHRLHQMTKRARIDATERLRVIRGDGLKVVVLKGQK